MPEEKSGAKMLRIGELARLTGSSVQSIRFYEREGLLKPVSRTAARYRMYSGESLRILRHIKRAQALGATLDDIKMVFKVRKAGVERCRDWDKYADMRLKEMRGKVAELQEKIRNLESILQVRRDCRAKQAAAPEDAPAVVCPVKLKIAGIKALCRKGIVDFGRNPAEPVEEAGG